MRDWKYFTVAAVAASILLGAIALAPGLVLAEEQMTNPEALLSHDDVKSLLATDEEISQAIDQSQRSYSEFRRAFEQREFGQVGFLVTALRRDGTTLVPVGILVDRIQGEAIEGREVSNSLIAQPMKAMTCHWDQIVDWRYADAFELVGGRLYRVLYRRQSWAVQTAVDDELPFLVELDKGTDVDPEFHDLFRDIANLRYAEVQRKLRADKKLHHKKAFIPALAPRSRAHPKPTHRSVEMPRTTVSLYAVEFADAKMVRLLHDLGVLQEKEGEAPLLEASVIQGNIATTRCMLELGFDPDVVNDFDNTPLNYALMWDRVEMVALLLEHGADANRAGWRGHTPLFFVVSVEAAKQLLAAGADADVVYEDGVTCVQWQLQTGYVDIADLLVSYGANREAHWRIGPTKAESEANELQALKEERRSTNPQALAEIELRHSVDYGFVLPVRSIPVPIH